MRGVSGVALAVVMPLVGIGQQPGWVQDVPWIQTASLNVHSWSAGETFTLQQQTLFPEFGAVAWGFTQIGTFSCLAVCAGTQVKLTPQVAAQLRMGCMARRWLPANGVRWTVRPNLHALIRGQGNDGQTVTLGIAFAPEGPLPHVQAREELVIQLKGVVERNERRLHARCTWTGAGAALEWQWLTRLDAQSYVGVYWRMLPGFLGILGSREWGAHRWSVGILRGIRHQGMSLVLGLDAC